MNKYTVLKEYTDANQVRKNIGDIVLMTEKQAEKLTRLGFVQLQEDLTRVLVDLRYEGQRLFLFNVATNVKIGEVSPDGILATLVGDTFGTHYGDVQGNVAGNLTGNVKGIVTNEFETPVNAAAATYLLEAATIAQITDDDVVEFDGNVFTRVASMPAAGEFTNAVELAALINGLANWTAAEGGGDVTITSDIAGLIGNQPLVIRITEDSTSGGDGAGNEATATISAETIAVFEVGDTVAFDGNTFTRALAVGVGEFSDASELAGLINALTDWAAVENMGAVDITAATDDIAFNGIDIDITLSRTLAGGIDGTVAEKGTLYADEDYIYMASDDNTIADGNWKRLDAVMSTY